MATTFDIGGNVRRLREARGISLSALARQAGISKAYLSQMENNPDKRPSVEIVYQLARALDVRLTELIGLEDPGPPAAAGGAGTVADAGTGASTMASGDTVAAGGTGVSTVAVDGTGGSTVPATARAAGTRRAGAAVDPTTAGDSAAVQTGAAIGSAAVNPPAATHIAAPDPGDLPPGLRIFWTEHPELPLEDIRRLAAVAASIGTPDFTATDYWLLHETIRLLRRRLPPDPRH